MPQMLARPVADLIEVLSRLPGIGPKTASRLTFYLLRNQEGLAEALAEAFRRCAKARCCASAASTSRNRAHVPSAPTAAGTRARFAWSRSRWMCWPSSEPENIAGSTTYCTARYRRLTACIPEKLRIASW